MLILEKLIELRKALPPLPADMDRATLIDRFLIPPFSVLDARQGYWQKRKKMWLELGIQSELGRGTNVAGGHMTSGAPSAMEIAGGFGQRHGMSKANATPGGSLLPAMKLNGDGKTQRGGGKGRRIAGVFGTGDADGQGLCEKNAPRKTQSASHDGLTVGVTCDAYRREDEELTAGQSGTSIFDPVICELAYRWFTPVDGSVLDPFAGGSVRGIVAARLGRTYAGIDLRAEQAQANYTQADAMGLLEQCGDGLKWVVGDALNVCDLLPGQYDFVFSCPPYADLERYSDDPRDLSTMDYNQFLRAYRQIISRACSLLKDDRFACFVVGDIRDTKTGCYRNFVSDTISAFRDAGLELYNEAVLLTMVGSLPIRVGRQFDGYRKLGKTHQNVLVFLKGDAGRAAAACGEVDVDDLDMPECVAGRVAICAADTASLSSQGYINGDGSEVPVLNLPDTQAYLLCDIIRSEARTAGKASVRAWIGTPDGWRRVPDTEELTYIIGGQVYLNRVVFPDAKLPTAPAPVLRKLRGS